MSPTTTLPEFACLKMLDARRVSSPKVVGRSVVFRSPISTLETKLPQIIRYDAGAQSKNEQ